MDVLYGLLLWLYYILLSTNENNSQENKLKNVFIYKTNKIEVELNSDTHKTYSDVIIFIRINIIKRLFSKAEKKNIYTFALKHSPLDFFLISSDDTYKTIDDKRKEIIKYIIDMLFSPLPDNVINILELYDTVFYNKSSRSIKFQEKYLREEYQKLEKELSRKNYK